MTAIISLTSVAMALVVALIKAVAAIVSTNPTRTEEGSYRNYCLLFTKCSSLSIAFSSISSGGK